ncbi:MAG: lamin tail domain-containing protein [Patescibacteria group bacterium]|nr:lamin tail domain-containing protein [Patescibacteria group bacterium]MDD4610547.1 lamin tail domain-containing protein [Patescibacteria group bacterium]
MAKRGNKIIFTLLAIGLLFFCNQKFLQAEEPAIVINEIAWMGTAVEGIDKEDWWRYEWLELYNNTDAPITLDGWKIELFRPDIDYTIDLLGDIQAKSYFIIVASDKIFSEYDKNYSNLTGKFNNSGQKVVLKDSQSTVVDSIDASSGWPGGDRESKQTMERKSDGAWQTSASVGGTPGRKNSPGSVAAKDPEPIANSSESSSDSQADNETAASNDTESEILVLAKSSLSDIKITEIFPRPKLVTKPDEVSEEFIELYNSGSQDVDLTGWKLGDGTERRYELNKIIIKAEEYLPLWQKDMKIVLDNGGDSVKLFQPQKTTASQTVKYKNAGEGVSYSLEPKENKVWQWSEVPTPGKINETKLPNNPPVIVFDIQDKITAGETAIYDASDSYDIDGDDLKFQWDFGDGVILNLDSPEHTYFYSGSYTIKLTLNDGKTKVVKEKTIKVLKSGEEKNSDTPGKSSTNIKNSETAKTVKKTNTLVKSTGSNAYASAKGVVLVLPGILASQYFYAANEDGGFQVYSYKKDFPKLAVGDLISISGTLSEVNGEKRMKTKSQADIKVIGHEEIPAGERLTCGEVNEDYAGKLILLEGEVTQKKGQTIYLDDGTAEVAIYLKQNTGLTSGVINEGEKIKITGIVSKTSSGVQILPRSMDDIIKSDGNAQVLGEKVAGDEWSLAERNKKIELIKYFLILVGGVIIIGGGLLIRKVRNKTQGA